MASIPVTVDQMEQIVEVVARDLLEKWAIDDRFTSDQVEEYTQNAVNDTVFVINAFMENMNTLMMTQAQELKII
jgi:hypothetical protein